MTAMAVSSSSPSSCLDCHRSIKLERTNTRCCPIYSNMLSKSPLWHFVSISLPLCTPIYLALPNLHGCVYIDNNRALLMDSLCPSSIPPHSMPHVRGCRTDLAGTKLWGCRSHGTGGGTVARPSRVRAGADEGGVVGFSEVRDVGLYQSEHPGMGRTLDSIQHVRHSCHGYEPIILVVGDQL